MKLDVPFLGGTSKKRLKQSHILVLTILAVLHNVAWFEKVDNIDNQNGLTVILAIFATRWTPLKFGWNRGGVVLSRKTAISLKRGKIGPSLLLTTNRKSHTHFRLVPKSTTSDDLEGPLRTVFQNMCVFRSPPWKFERRYTILSVTTM